MINPNNNISVESGNNTTTLDYVLALMPIPVLGEISAYKVGQHHARPEHEPNIPADIQTKKDISAAKTTVALRFLAYTIPIAAYSMYEAFSNCF